MWWKERRPEIVEDFEREVYGRIPKNIPKVTWDSKNQLITNLFFRVYTRGCKTNCWSC